MPDKTPRIHQYVRQGNLAGISSELARGTHVDIRDPATDQTPLMVAVSSPKAPLALVQLLLQYGADANAIATDPHFASMQEGIASLLANPDIAARIEASEVGKIAIERMRKLASSAPQEIPRQDHVLSLAVSAGNLEKVEALLNAGADIHYSRPHGYDVLIDVMHGRSIARDPTLIQLVQLLIRRGARLNSVTDYSESALSVASNDGRFDVVKVILDAGADPAPLEWTPLMHAIALGSLSDVQAQLTMNPDLAARDFWSRTPWLLSLQVGDLPKAQLLLSAGANRTDRGRCGKTPLMYPLINFHTPMLRWLLALGLNPNETDDFQTTPLADAAETGAVACARLLLDAGAHIDRVRRSESAIRLASTLAMVDLLVHRGADLNDISNEMRAALTGLPSDGIIDASPADYHAAKHPRFGQSNPEKMNLPFWQSMIRSGSSAYQARTCFDDAAACDGRSCRDAASAHDGPVWTFQRFGKSINILPDGRIIEIAGEHEDSYDPEFCIYNDVIVHHGNGTFDIYGYPKDCFPPTDFHSATHVGNYLYIIGSLGYLEERHPAHTPVFRLDLDSYRIEPLATSGENPGWIHDHTAALINDTQIQITGGRIHVLENDRPTLQDNPSQYLLNLHTLQWRKLP